MSSVMTSIDSDWLNQPIVIATLELPHGINMEIKLIKIKIEFQAFTLWPTMD